MISLEQNHQVDPKQPKKSRLKIIGLLTIGIIAVALLVAFTVFPTEIKSAFKLLFRLTPVHAKHIPRSSLTLTRTNFASIALKTGLHGSPNDPVYRKMVEYGSKLYPRFDLLLANPVKETGIELADDTYIFTELLDDQTPTYGVLFGISDSRRFEEFIQMIRPGSPSSEGGISLIRLDSGAGLYWNKSFALIYGGIPSERLKQRAMAIMVMSPNDSLKEDPVKKKWLEGKDDLLASIDLEKATKLPGIDYFTRKSPYKPETFIGSSLSLALNFDKGRCALDARATGTALLAEINKSFVPPAKDFLAGISADNYQLFFATHIQLSPVLEALRQLDPESYRKGNDLVSFMTGSSIEQLVNSFTGDICVVLDNFKQLTIEKKQGVDFFGNQMPPIRSTSTNVEGTAAVGIKPDSSVANLIQKILNEIPANNINRDGKLYRISKGRDLYLLADNGYLAFSTRHDTARSLANFKKGEKPVMSAGLLDRATSGIATLDLKLTSLLPNVSGSGLLPRETRSALDQAASHLAELRVSSRMEKEQALTQVEIIFKDESKNGLNQIAEMTLATAETQLAEYRIKSYNAAALSNLKNAKTSLEAYFADHQQYPGSLADTQFKASEGVTVTCEHAPQGYACVSKHRDGNHLYATMYNDAFIRTRQCEKKENPPVPLGSFYEALDRI